MARVYSSGLRTQAAGREVSEGLWLGVLLAVAAQGVPSGGLSPETGRKGPGHRGRCSVWAPCEQFVVTHQPGVAGGAEELERKDLAGTHMVALLVNKS